MKAGVFQWQFDKDYPATIPGDDSQLPISYMFVKAIDGLDWMASFDTHPAHIGDATTLRAAFDSYRAQGIGCVPWGVAKGGGNAYSEGRLAARCAVTCEGLFILDLEPYPGFWTGGPAEVAQYLRGFRDGGGRELWLTPDTRAGALAGIAFNSWIADPIVTRVLPQGYWTDFQTGWEHGLHLSLDPIQFLPKSKVWPVLPANGATQDAGAAITWLEQQGYPGFAIWRRGTLTQDMIDALNARPAYSVGGVVVPPAPVFDREEAARRLTVTVLDARSTMTAKLDAIQAEINATLRQ